MPRFCLLLGSALQIYASDVGSTLQDRMVVWVVWIWVGNYPYRREKMASISSRFGSARAHKTAENRALEKIPKFVFLLVKYLFINDTLDIKTYKTIFFGFIFIVTWFRVFFLILLLLFLKFSVGKKTLRSKTRLSDWIFNARCRSLFLLMLTLRFISSNNSAFSKQLYTQSAKVHTGPGTALSNHSLPWSNWCIYIYIF